MAGFIQKYAVRKARTVTCRMGVAHYGEKGITIQSFTGEDDKAKQETVDALVKMGALEKVPLTDSEKEALEVAEKEESERIKKEKEALAAAEARSTAIMEADFDKMNKDILIKFAKDYNIELKGTLVEDIRDELEIFQNSLTAPE